MRRAFNHIVLLNSRKARASVNARTAIAGFMNSNLTVAILKWQVHAFHKRGLAHIKSDHFKEVFQVDPASRAVFNLRSKAADDPRVLVLRWPSGKEMESIISLSACYHVTASGKHDKRTKDIQVRFDSGERIQMPLKIFNEHPDSFELLTDFKAELKEKLASKNAQSRASLRRQLSASKSMSLARLKKRNIKSSTSDEDAERDARAGARADLSQFLDESMGRAHTESSSSSVAELFATSSDDDEDAVSEFNRDLQAIKDAEARYAAAKSAKKNGKQKPKSRRVPVSKPVASPQDLQSMAAEAGADADFQELLSASNAQAQQDANKVMLERMALFEQQVFNLQTSLTNANNTSSASQSQYGLTAWEQTFRNKLDAMTLVHAEHFDSPSATTPTTQPA